MSQPLQDSIRERISRLLALSESPNEHEAKAALLKARELMAKHKLTMRDVQTTQDVSLNKIRTEVECGTRVGQWKRSLAVVVAEAHCCRAITLTGYCSKSYGIEFWGLDDDPVLARNIFEYACRCVSEHIENERRRRGFRRTAAAITAYGNAYGIGFAGGMHHAYMRQMKDNPEWGLVVVEPKKLTDAVNALPDAREVNIDDAKSDPDAFTEGYVDGKAFDPSSKLGSPV